MELSPVQSNDLCNKLNKLIDNGSIKSWSIVSKSECKFDPNFRSFESLTIEFLNGEKLSIRTIDYA